jgi:hypothetical protein
MHPHQPSLQPRLRARTVQSQWQLHARPHPRQPREPARPVSCRHGCGAGDGCGCGAAQSCAADVIAGPLSLAGGLHTAATCSAAARPGPSPAVHRGCLAVPSQRADQRSAPRSAKASQGDGRTAGDHSIARREQPRTSVAPNCRGLETRAVVAALPCVCLTQELGEIGRSRLPQIAPLAS